MRKAIFKQILIKVSPLLLADLKLVFMVVVSCVVAQFFFLLRMRNSLIKVPKRSHKRLPYKVKSYWLLNKSFVQQEQSTFTVLSGLFWTCFCQILLIHLVNFWCIFGSLLDISGLFIDILIPGCRKSIFYIIKENITRFLANFTRFFVHIWLISFLFLAYFLPYLLILTLRAIKSPK